MCPAVAQAALENNPVRLDLNPLHPGLAMEQYPHALGATSASAALVEYILQHFSPAELHVLELGSGSGVVSILLSLSRKAWRITGIDIQVELVELARRNALGLNPRPEFRQADLRQLNEPDNFDLVLSNPPWQKLQSGWQSPNKMRAISRMEVCCTLPDITACCAQNLKTGAHAVLMYPSHRSEELQACAKLQGLITADICTESDNWTIFHLIKG